jgi:hypothetical protein
MSTLAKRLGKKAKEEAKKTAKQVGAEMVEIPKGIVTQATGAAKTESPIVEAMLQKTEDTKNLPKEINGKKAQKTLDYLQKELEKLRAEKKMEEKQRAQQPAEATVPEKPEPLEEPTPKRKVGLPQFGRKGKTKGTGEMIKSRR